MSVFRGSITEYPGVIVDHFIPFNCERGRAFFLSHCHKGIACSISAVEVPPRYCKRSLDHMTGLGSPALLSALQRRNAKLYCSEVTRLLLLSDPGFTKLTTSLESLPMEEPISMTLEAYSDCQVLTFTVTLLPAGHCPGSAMFFFQGTNGNVLYTGDFRLTLEETRRLHLLHCGGRVLDITTLYLDTTFCTPVATEIPSREVSRDHILTLIESWLSQSPKNVVHLQCSMFGYEHVLMGVAKKFNTKIHIAAWKLNAYKGIPAVAECLTTDGNSTRIHACNFRKGAKRCPGLPCGSHLRGSQAHSVLRIKPSTLWFLFASKTITEPYVFIPAHNKYRVIHSMHASYSEICSFVSYLKPKRVVPCVVPLGDSGFKNVHARLKDLLPQSGTDIRGACSETISVEKKDQPPLQPLRSCLTGKLRKRGQSERDQIPANSSESDSDWSSGESNPDTIDEFPSSEEQTQRRTAKNFSDVRNPLPSGLGLPSMLTHTHHALLTSARAPSPPPSSLEVSDGSATLGSLQQTPLDLSFGSSVSEAQPKDSAPSTDLPATNTNDDVKEPCPKQPVLIEGVRDDQHSLYVIESEIGTVPEMESTTERKDSSDRGWHLSLDESPETKVCSTPHSKRCKLEDPSGDCDDVTENKKTTRKLFHKHSPAPGEDDLGAGQTKEGASTQQYLCSEQAGRPCDQLQSVEYIDLTQESDEECSVQRNSPTTGKQDHQCLQENRHTSRQKTCRSLAYDREKSTNSADHQKPTPQEVCSSRTDSGSIAGTSVFLGEEPEVIILSDSQASTSTVAPLSQQSVGPTSCNHGLAVDPDTPVCLGAAPLGPASLLCLPPTPGREGVESILKRRSIAFS